MNNRGFLGLSGRHGSLLSFNMPKLKPSSTERRIRQSEKIEALGEIMVRPCLHCRETKSVCRVHVGSGRCGVCTKENRRDCNVKVTEAEWSRLRRQREALEKKVSEHRRKMRELNEAYEASLRRIQEEEVVRRRIQEEEAAAWEKKARLQRELELLERRETEAIAVEEAALMELPDEDVVPGPSLSLSPPTWSLREGISDDFWSDPDLLSVPELLVSGNLGATSGTVAEAGSSSPD